MVYLIRHGQTDWNAKGFWQGEGGPGLNDIGKKQAAATARKLTNLNITAMFSSDIDRAVETADIISTSTGLRPIQLSGLRERDCGEWSGKTSEQIAQENPGINLKLGVDSGQDPDDVESWVTFRERAINAFKTVLKQKDGDIAIVTHGGVIYSILSYIDPATHFKIPENGNITVLKDNGSLSVESLSY